MPELLKAEPEVVREVRGVFGHYGIQALGIAELRRYASDMVMSRISGSSVVKRSITATCR